jgi:hypothetical protein
MKEWQTRTLAVAVLGLASLAFAGPVSAKELSEKSVRVLMEYAWTILPAKFTMPDGKVIEVDKKSKKKETLVPIEAAREVIKTGYNSAQAQLCEMWEEQTVNYDAMMLTQRVKNKWTDQQLLYITTLHRMTIHMAAGKLKVSEKDGEQIVSLEPITPSKDTCNDEKRKKVREAVAAQVEAAKPFVPTKKADGPAQPVPASQKK